MSTTIEKVPSEADSFSIEPITYPVQKAMIAELSDEYMALSVAGVGDKQGLSVVHEARMKIKNFRLAIEKRRKELKASALEYGREVDGAAKELTALIAPIEQHLENEEGVVEREKKRLRDEEEARRQAKIRARLHDLQLCGVVAMASDVEGLGENEFIAMLAKAQADKKERDDAAASAAAEQARIAEQQRIEAERIAKERAELERQRAEQQAAQAKIDAEARRIADEKAAQDRKAELEEAKAAAAEKARLDAIVEQERKAAEAKKRAESEEAERKRIEGLRPDHEKLRAIADVVDNTDIPVVSEPAQGAVAIIEKALNDCAAKIRKAADKLLENEKARF